MKVTFNLSGRNLWIVAAILVALPPLAVVAAMLWDRVHVSGEMKLVLGLAAGAAFALWRGVKNLTEARLIEDRPTARIRSAPQGYVELSGTANGEPERCALGGEPCLWSDYSIHRRWLWERNGRTVDAHTSGAPFLLRDDTDECVVDPQAARVVAAADFSWYGFRSRPQRVPGAAARSASWLLLGPVHEGYALWVAALPLLAVFVFDAWGPAVAAYIGTFTVYYIVAGLLGPYGYRLRMIRPGEPLHALGTFASEAGGDGRYHHRLSRAGDERRPFILSTLPEGALVGRSRRRALPWFAAFVVLLALMGLAMRTYF